MVLAFATSHQRQRQQSRAQPCQSARFGSSDDVCSQAEATGVGSTVSDAHAPQDIQLDVGAQFQGRSSSRRSLGWPPAIASRVALR